MKTSQAGLDRIKRYEACVLHIYKDQAGLDTIGVGHLIYETGILLDFFRAGITQAQADILLAQDLIPAENAVNSLVKSAITQGQFDSLVSFAFNVGVSGLASSSLLKAINADASADEITTDFLKWDKIHVDGQLVESAGLKARRLDEAKSWT